MAELKIDITEILAKSGCTPAVIDVAGERVRQVTQEGWSTGNDDEHENREMARAAQCYLEHFIGRQWLVDSYKDGLARYQNEPSTDCWPWDEKWWKPKNPRRDLVRAAALIIAEIERLDRLTQGKKSES